MIESAIRTRLVADPTLSGLVAGRIYPGIAPQRGALPRIVYSRTSTRRILEMAGPSGLAQPRLRFEIFANDYSDAKDIAEALRVSLDGFAGTISGTVVALAEVEEEDDGIVPPSDGGEQAIYSVSIEALIWEQE